MIIDVLRKKMEKLPKAVWFIATIPIVAIVCLISMNLAVDYDYHAILIGYFLYIFHEKSAIAIPVLLPGDVQGTVGTVGVWTDFDIQWQARQAE